MPLLSLFPLLCWLSSVWIALAQAPLPQGYTVQNLLAGQAPPPGQGSPPGSYPSNGVAPAPGTGYFNPLSSSGYGDRPSGSSSSSYTPSLMARSKRKFSRRSRDIVEGIIESYMHKVELQPGEKRCLERSTGQIASDVVGTGDDLVTAVKGLVEQGKDNNLNMKMSGGLMAAVPTVVDAATKVTSMVRLTERLVKECVQGDALSTFNTTVAHIQNMTFVGNRLLANGADIAQALAKSVTDWERGDYRRVGEDVGEAMRKVLLAKASKTPVLPEGEPPVEIVDQVMQGMTEGFFVRGTELEIKDLAAPDVDIKINLHNCINQNQPLFQSAMKAAWTLVAQISANKEMFGFGKNQNIGTNPFANQQGGTNQQRGQAARKLQAGQNVPLAQKVPISGAINQVGQNGAVGQQAPVAGTSNGGTGVAAGNSNSATNPFGGAQDFMAANSAWMGDFALSMMQIPAAMQRCNIRPETTKMFGEAIHSLKYARVKFDLPQEQMSKKEMEKETSLLMARAVESWTRWRFEDFGDDVGQLLREMVLLIFPQKYSIDARGVLRRSLEPDHAAPTLIGAVPRMSGNAFWIFVAVASLSMPTLFFATRSLQMCQRRMRYDSVLERCAPPQDSRTLPMTAADVHPVMEVLVPVEEVTVE